MKIVYSWTIFYETVITKPGLEKLTRRRSELVDKFDTKAVKMPRFRDSWFASQVPNRPGIRSNKKIQHHRCRMERYIKIVKFYANATGTNFGF